MPRLLRMNAIVFDVVLGSDSLTLRGASKFVQSVCLGENFRCVCANAPSLL